MFCWWTTAAPGSRGTPAACSAATPPSSTNTGTSGRFRVSLLSYHVSPWGKALESNISAGQVGLQPGQGSGLHGEGAQQLPDLVQDRGPGAGRGGDTDIIIIKMTEISCLLNSSLMNSLNVSVQTAQLC